MFVAESKKAQQELRKAAVDAARMQKKVKKGDPFTFEWFDLLYILENVQYTVCSETTPLI